MKRLQLILLVAIMTFSGQLIHSQQADRIQRGMRGYTPPPRLQQGTYIDTQDPQEQTEIIIQKCEEVLKIDDFQKEIMKNMVYRKIEAENAILTDKGNTREDRKKKITDLNNQFLAELSGILTPDQVQQYNTLDFTETKEEKKEKKKRKKKEKRKKKNDS